MQFLKVHPQLALNVDKIIRLHITGREDNAQISATMLDGTEVTLTRHQSFHDAELALLDLTDRLEALPD